MHPFPLTNAPPTPEQLLETYRQTYAHQLSVGLIKPLIWPYHFLGVYLIIIYLLIPHKRRRWVYRARWLVLAVVVAFEVKALRESRCMSMAVSYGVGLMAAWTVVWSSTLLVWNRPQWDFKRVEMIPCWKKNLGGTPKELENILGGAGKRVQHSIGARSGVGNTNGLDNFGNKVNGNVSDKSAVSGYQSVEKGNLQARKGTSLQSNDAQKEEVIAESEFYWQSYPDGENSFRDRLDWVLDLCLNFQGPGWSWAISSLPPIPMYITSSLFNPSEVPSTKRLFEDPKSKSHSKMKLSDEYETKSSNKKSRKSIFIKFCIGYVTIDILKYIMMLDPYFYMGPNSYAPPTYLPTFITTTPILLRAYRSLLSFCSVITCLNLGFLLAPLFLHHFLGPSALGLRGHSFMYPSSPWGSFVANTLDKGLAGLWGGTWHQVFRFAFSSPTNYFVTKGWVKRHSEGAKIVGLLVAFSVSGFLHFCGSITQFGKTRPLYSALFFLLQGLGIIVQNTFTSILSKQVREVPRWMKRSGTFLFTFIWMFYTAPLLIDDFARGGLWMFEPLPFSFVKGLLGEGWWCWGGELGVGVGLYRGERWYESGIAVY